ncbi:MAG: VPLPA-CTERM sorting domain-containing protein [Pseudomonadota bacterium]
MKTIATIAAIAAASLTGLASASTTLIDFEGLADDDVVTNQFANVTFSSQPGSVVYVTEQPGVGIGDNFICSGLANNMINCVDEVLLDFTSAVSNLSFFAVGDNNVGVVGQVEVFVDNMLAGTVDLIADGNFATTEFVDLTAFNNVTGIRIFNITDAAGLGYDNFEFDVGMAEVPVPAAALLFVGGAAGFVRRRKDA